MTRLAWLFRYSRLVVGGALCYLGLSLPAIGQRPALSMLDQLDRGRWELRMRDPASTVQSMCLQGGRQLIQLRHVQQSCERYVVEDEDDTVTVQYTCRGRGFGRTHIRRESARLVQIETQGIADGLPFDFVAEGRRVGDCVG